MQQKNTNTKEIFYPFFISQTKKLSLDSSNIYKFFIGPLSAVTLPGKQIKVVQHSKCLGVTIDSNLSHVKNASRTFSVKVNKLYNMRQMPKQTLLVWSLWLFLKLSLDLFSIVVLMFQIFSATFPFFLF